MTWTNPLDKVPQIPQDWANHIAQGGIGSCALMLVAAVFLPPARAVLAGFVIMSAVSIAKKVADFVKEGETWQMCAGKALVTVLWPASLWALTLLL